MISQNQALRESDTITVTGTVKEEKRNGTSGQTLNTGTSVGSPVTLHHPVGKQQYSPHFTSQEMGVQVNEIKQLVSK